MRVLVLWNASRRVEAGEDESWARAEVEKLRGHDGIAAMALHPVNSAAARHPRPYGWCLELRIADGRTANQIVRAKPCAEFLGDLRLLGMQPSVLAIDEDL